MTTTADLATIDSPGALTVLPPAQPPSHAAKQMLMAHAEMMQTAWQLASKMCNTQMVPTRFRGKPEDGTAAILYGAELGLNPIQSLQRVVPIHGMPSLEARTMVALLKARGYRIKTTAKSDESVTVQGIDPSGDVYEATWTIERARLAGYVPEIDPKTGKYKTNANGKLAGNEKYITNPQAMLTAKSQSEVCREMAPDVLMGISYTSEDLESENWGSDLAQEQVRAPAGRGAAVTVDEIMTDVAPAPPVPDLPDRDAELDAARQRADDHAAAGTMPDPNEDLDAAELYAENYLAPDAALAYLSGGEGVVEPAGVQDDHAHAAVEPDPEPEPEPVAVEPTPEPAAEPEAPKAAKTAMRKAVERRLFNLLGEAAIASEEKREDRLIVYRFIIGRDTIQSTDDLSDVEVAKVCDCLYEWQQKKKLGDKVTEILNTATLAQDDA